MIRLRELRIPSLGTSPAGQSVLGALVAFGLMTILWWQAGSWYHHQLLREQRSQLAADISLRGNALSSALNRRFARLEGLHAFVMSELGADDFDQKFESFAADLYEFSRGVLNFAVAPEGVIQFIYPPEGNEAIQGYDPLSDPRSVIRQKMHRMIETGEIVVTGPVDLLQGGVGVIGRMAIYDQGAYWGFVNMVVRLEPILGEAELDIDADDVDFALRNDAGFVFYGPEEVFDNDPVFYRVELPDGWWELAGVPAGGWKSAVRGQLLVFQSFGFLIIGLTTGVLYLLLSRQAHLELAVEQRTSEISKINRQLERDITERRRAELALREQENQYRRIFEAFSDGIFINDLQGNLLDFNPAAHHMHGYTHEEFRQLHPLDFIHPDSHGQFGQFLEEIRAGRQYRVRAIDVRKDGTPLHIEVFGTPFKYRGEPHALAVVRDITEQVHAYQLLEQRVEERTRELSTVLEISKNVASTLDLEPLLGLVLDQLKQVVDYTGSTILTNESSDLVIRAYRGPLPEDFVTRLRFPFGGYGFHQEVVRRQEPIIIDDVNSDEPLAENFRNTLGSVHDGAFRYINSWMGVPLTVKDRVIGILAVSHSLSRFYTERHAKLALAFANQAAIAIENARLFEQAQALASLEERQKLARELHDSVSQALYGIALGARTAQTLLERIPDPGRYADVLREPLDYVISLSEAGLTEMRALIFELRPDSLETEGIIAALQKQAAALQARYQLAVEANLIEEPDIPVEAKQALYRIAQEALHNTVKHSRAQRAAITLSQNNGILTLVLSDDGDGFDPSASFPGHLGLQSMRERAERIGAELQIESSPSAGTRVQVLLKI